MIHIRKGGEFERVVSGFPWLMLPRFDSTSDACRVLIRFFGGHCYGLLHLIMTERLSERHIPLKLGRRFFPFYEFDDMEDEVLPLVEDNFLASL